jgi:hypothetical protein
VVKISKLNLVNAYDLTLDRQKIEAELRQNHDKMLILIRQNRKFRDAIGQIQGQIDRIILKEDD